MAEWEKFGMVGSPHENGDRMYGFTGGYARDLWAAGTPTVSSLRRSSITPAIAGVDVGDLLDVVFDGTCWTVRAHGVLVGKLSWTLRTTEVPSWVDGKPLTVRDGLLEVQRVFVNDGRVVNLGGFVRPL